MSILDDIVRSKREEIASRKQAEPEQRLRQRLPERRLPCLSAALRKEGLNVIAEVKYRSPSHGPFQCQLPAVEVAAEYVRNGAAALSVLTDERYFGGRLEYLREVFEAMVAAAQAEDSADAEAVRRWGDGERPLPAVPLLRKDFILDRYQVVEAAASGASAYLLIVACLAQPDLESLLHFGEDLELEALVEVHDPFELERAVEAGARLIGVNNRNLKTFEVDLRTSFDIARRLEGETGFLLVAESGLRERVQLEELRDAGFAGFLIGSAFMEHEHPGQALGRLLRGEDLEAGNRKLGIRS